MPDYIIKGKRYTDAEVAEIAKKNGVSLDYFIKDVGATYVDAKESTFDVKGKSYTNGQLEEIAKKNGVSLDYLKKDLGLKKKETTPKSGTSGNNGSGEALIIAKTTPNGKVDIYSYKQLDAKTNYHRFTELPNIEFAKYEAAVQFFHINYILAKTKQYNVAALRALHSTKLPMQQEFAELLANPTAFMQWYHTNYNYTFSLISTIKDDAKKASITEKQVLENVLKEYTESQHQFPFLLPTVVLHQTAKQNPTLTPIELGKLVVQQLQPQKYAAINKVYNKTGILSEVEENYYKDWGHIAIMYSAVAAHQKDSMLTQAEAEYVDSVLSIHNAQLTKPFNTYFKNVDTMLILPQFNISIEPPTKASTANYTKPAIGIGVFVVMLIGVLLFVRKQK